MVEGVGGLISLLAEVMFQRLGGEDVVYFRDPFKVLFPSMCKADATHFLAGLS